MENWKKWGLIALVVIGGVVAIKFLAGKGADILGGVSNMRVGLYNWVITGIMAITFIIVAKLVTAKVQVPGLTEAVQMV